MNSTHEIAIDITSPEGATESDVLVSAVLNAMKPAIVRIVAEAVKQAAHIERDACLADIDAEREDWWSEPPAGHALSGAQKRIRARGEAP